MEPPPVFLSPPFSPHLPAMRWIAPTASRHMPRANSTSSKSAIDADAGVMIGEIALTIEMGVGAVDIGKTIHPSPTLGESIGIATEVAHCICTDLPPARK